MGRLLIALFLIERRVLPAPLLYISAFFEATRQDYYTRLLRVTKQGDWENWLLYFLNGVARQSEDAISRAERINDLLVEWRSQTAGLSSTIPHQLVDLLARNPFITVQKTAELLGVAFNTIQRSIDKLEKLEILSLEKQSKRNRIYCAKKLLTILEEPAKLVSSLT